MPKKFSPERVSLRSAGYLELAKELRELGAFLTGLEEAYNGQPRALSSFRACGRGISVCAELRARLERWDEAERQGSGFSSQQSRHPSLA